MRRKDIDLVVFDLDGTLAETKSAMDSEMSEVLNLLLKKLKVSVISGGAFPQFEKQFLTSLSAPVDALNNLFLFPTSGTAFFRFSGGNWLNVYHHALAADEKKKIFKAFEKILPEAGYERPENPQGEIIEDRFTQITFSALGQFAPTELKKQWDPDMLKRQKIKELLDPHLSDDFEVRVAGTTSVDVTRKGIDKAFGISQMEIYLNVPRSRMIFIGDRLFPGGNDYPVKQAGVKSYEVAGPEDTKKLIRKVISSR